MNTEQTFDKRLLGFTAVALILGAGLAVAASVSADEVEKGACGPEHREAIVAAMDDGDYEAWAELMDGRGRISEVITEDNFETFVALHEARKDGDQETVEELREELGLGQHPQDGTGHQGEGKGMRADKMHRGEASGDGINNRWGS